MSRRSDRDDCFVSRPWNTVFAVASDLRLGTKVSLKAGRDHLRKDDEAFLRRSTSWIHLGLYHMLEGL